MLKQNIFFIKKIRKIQVSSDETLIKIKKLINKIIKQFLALKQYISYNEYKKQTIIYNINTNKNNIISFFLNFSYCNNYKKVFVLVKQLD